MNRIERIFADLRGVAGHGGAEEGGGPERGKTLTNSWARLSAPPAAGQGVEGDAAGSGGGSAKRALMPFVTAGDPDLSTTMKMLSAMESAGAAVCELGVPFSDPIADGPVIQASMTHALAGGLRVEAVFEAVAQVRPKLGLGLVMMVSYSIVHRLGLEAFVRRAKEAGIDGFIFPDLPLEESEPVRAAVARAGLILSMLIAPSTSEARARRIARASSGFVYVVSREGTTGERAALPAELPDRLRGLRAATDLPMAVGFGISSAAQVRQVAEVADAVIVGSAMMRRVADHRDRGPDAVVGEVGAFTRELASGLAPLEPPDRVFANPRTGRWSQEEGGAW